MTSEWSRIAGSAGLWHAEYRIPGFRCRSVALRMRDGRGLVWSPPVGGPDRFPVSDLGKPLVLVAPNYFHHMGLSEWLRADSQSIAVATAMAQPRLRSKRGLTQVAEPNEVASQLPDGITFLTPAGTRAGELWLRVEQADGVCWVVGDAFFNVPRLARAFAARTVQRIARSAPGLCVSRVAKWGLIADRRGYAAWVRDQIERDRPRTLVPLHGEVLMADDLPERLTEAMRERFG